jgi:rhodanese-related sulfurtransferase
MLHHLIETKKLNFPTTLIDQVYELQPQEQQESPAIIDIRETEQYGISLSIDDNTYERILNTTKEILDMTKEIIQE